MHAAILFIVQVMPLVLATGLPAAELAGWDDLIRAWHAGERRPVLVYFGSADNHLPRMLRSGRVAMSGLGLVTISARERVCNPMTGGLISGGHLRRLFAAQAGSLLFLDGDGLPIPQSGLAQLVHGDDQDLIALWCRFAAGDHFRDMTIAEFGHACGQEEVLERAVARVRHSLAPHLLDRSAPLVPARVKATGGQVDPWRENGTFFIYTTNSRGRIFRAQIAEISAAFATLRPRVTVIVPDDEESDPAAIPPGIACVLASGHRAAFSGPSPCIIITAHHDGNETGMELSGFQSADDLAHLLGMPLPETSHADEQDIPSGETDDQADPARQAGPAAAEAGDRAFHNDAGAFP